MEFSIFSWLTISILFIIFGFSFILGESLKKYINYKFGVSYLLGLICFSIFFINYLMNSIELWISWNKIILPFIRNNLGAYAYLFEEVWYTIAFFRNIWPSLLLAVLFIAIDSALYPITARYRMMCRFNHNKLLIMIGSLFIYFFIDYFSPNNWLSNYFLGIAVYTAVYYWKFGYTTILYILRRSHIPYGVSMILLLGIIILSKEYFILPLIAYIGFGISDIWMDYHFRNASSMVFSINFIK